MLGVLEQMQKCWRSVENKHRQLLGFGIVQELHIMTEVRLILIDTEEPHPMQRTKDLENIWIFATQAC